MRRYVKQTAVLRERKAIYIRELKIVDEERGTFEGYLSVFGNADQGDDIVVKGAFGKTLRELKSKQENTGSRYLFPFLWMHDENQPIGGCLQAQEDEKGLFIRGEIDLDTQIGQEKYSGLKKGYICEMSIGYAAIQRSFKDGFRYLKEVRLYEGSLITQGAAMNPEALVTDVKSASGKSSWPIADRARAWDNGAATKRIESWANGNAAKLASVHFWKDPSKDGTEIGAYKLLFCDVIGGAVKAIPRAVFACAGSHGIDSADIGGDEAAVKARIASYYRRMTKQFNDDSISVPWEASKMANRHARRAKAASFSDAYNAAQDDLQEQFHDANIALVQVIYAIMCDETETDKSSAVRAACDEFADTMAELADRAAAADFMPRLDYDDDSFADSIGNEVYGVDTDDDSYTGYYGVMSADREDEETKVGAAMSKTNHEKMGAALKQVKAGYQQLQMLHKSLSPTEQDYQANALGAINDPSRKLRAGADEERATTHITAEEGDAFESALANLARKYRRA